MKPVVILPTAQGDILEMFAYYAERGGVPLALELLDKVRQVAERIGTFPESGSPRVLQDRRLNGLRSIMVDKFDSYRAYYIETDEDIRIIRLLHSSRDLIAILESSPTS